MKYPITPEYIKTAPSQLVELYLALEEFLLKDICERFRLADTATATALEHIRTLQRRGYSYAYIKRRVKKTLGLSEAEYRRILGSAIEANKDYYTSVLSEKKLVGAVFDSPEMTKEINALVASSLGNLNNLTKTLGFTIRSKGHMFFMPLSEAYQHVLSEAEVKVWSGAQSYNEAIREAVKQLTDSGIRTVTWTQEIEEEDLPEKPGSSKDTSSAESESVEKPKPKKVKVHTDQVDVAVRRAVMTSVTQLADQYVQAMAEAVPTDYFEVTAHSGARDKDSKKHPWANHKKWQGKVYSVKNGDKYPSIYKVCGLGEVDGLEGANCRHMRYPFWDGISERTYTDEELANIDPPPFTYNDIEYSHYEATQRQRALERSIRAIRRELIGLEAAGDEEGYQIAAIKYNRLMAEYHSFCTAGQLREELDRAYVQEFSAEMHKDAERFLPQN